MSKITLRECRVASINREVSPKEVARLRCDVLGVSQGVFAGLLNVSIQAVHSWEQGTKRPSGMALRLLNLAEDRPSVFLSLLHNDTAERKTG